MNDLVTCIIPVFNGERFIGEAIESILAQTYEPIEIIVVDDGSTDGTAAAVTKYADRATYVRQDNAGPVVARNNGLERANGTFIAFLDSDDVWLPNKIERQMTDFLEQPELGISITHVQNVWEAEMADEEEQFKNHPRSRPMPGFVTQALLARRSTFEQIGPFNADLGHGDAADWFMRAENEGVHRIVLDDVLVHRRLHGNNLSRQESGASREEFLKLVKASLDRKRNQAS